MEYKENTLAKNARRWVLALGIIYTIGVIVFLVGLISLFALSSTNYAMLQSLGSEGKELIEIYKAQSRPLNLVIQGLLIVGQLFAVFLLFSGASSIKKGLLMDKTPFYLLLGILAISNIFNWFTGTDEFSIASFVVIALSLLLIGIPFWKVSKLNKIAEKNKG